ncbi:unnamed protein product [Adineta steineri]|uniref:Uncharacterized protein n=1 Tax=Adineta steineri TaxID=433720 RepID=A0A813WGX5_9BILA|nr:unnamed protein product [Adineta steineri]CAF3952650.1 unnamed protein product [Adineta steineri]
MIIHENLLELSNEYLTVQFNLSNGQIRSLNYKSQLITIKNETSLIYLNNISLDCSQLIDYKQNINSINFTYSCLNYELTTIYTLQSQWEFLEKQIYFTNINNETTTSLQTTFTILNLNISSVSIIQNRQDLNKQHTIFLRSNSSSTLGIFATWQNPFGQYIITSNNQTIISSYNIGMNTSYLSEGFLIGFYQLSSYWHTSNINYNERKAYEKATTFFYPVPQRQRSIKHAVGWDSNDYQIDISTQHGIDEYKRLIDRCSQLGIKSITFAPSNGNVSSREEASDAWGWESVLFLSLGEQIRLEQWKPYRNPIPETIQQMLDYAEFKQIKLVPYVYPPLGYQLKGKDQAWLYPSSSCKTVCSSLASVEFQQYFLQLLIDFAQVTGTIYIIFFLQTLILISIGIGGYAWDYNFFYDMHHTEYSQWRGWQWIRTELLLALPYLIMDHRFANQYDGPWSFITLNGYTSPLLSDENPETYPILYPSLHTDKISADFMRQGNIELRIEHFASMDSIPGFIGHQSERFSADGNVPWIDNNLRDFDFMGFSYSLLSNIATAGLNLVHTLLPARDLEEFYFLPIEFIQFWSYWLNWTDEHIEEIRNGIPFNIEQDWSLMKLNGLDGFLFLFNTNYKQINRKILFDGKLNLKNPQESGYWLLKEIYPQERFIQLIQYNEMNQFLLDGQSVTVYQLIFMPIINQPMLIGISGKAFLANETILIIDGVHGEAGTQTSDPIFIILPNIQSIWNVYLNGIEKQFKQDRQFIILTEPILFPGLYLPRTTEILNNTIIVNDLLLEQLTKRQMEYPIQWTEKELNDASWLGPHRLLLFICIQNPNDQWNITAQINNNLIIVHKGYNTRDHIDKDRFMGFYLDLTNIVIQSNKEYYLSLNMPEFHSGQFQGLFLENIERIFVRP